MKLAIAGVGNNVSALMRGIAYHGMLDAEEMPAMAVFDLAPDKAGTKLSDAMFQLALATDHA